MNNNERKYVEKVLNKFEEKKVTKLDELRKLDRKATQGATVFSAIFGSIWTLVFGFGMCLAMGIIAPGVIPIVAGILVGLLGMLMMGVNYPIYKAILKRGKAKYEAQIKALSEEILSQN